MKKMNILFILIMSILIFGTNNVYAESCSTIYNENFRPFLSNQLWFGNGLTSRQITLSDNVSIASGYNTLKGKLYVYSTNKGQTITTNINMSETCTSHTDYGTTYGNNGRIVYADGTTAQIDYSQRTFLCNGWSESGSTSSTVYYEPTYNIMNMRLTTTNGLKGCIVDSIGNFTCYLNNQATEITGAYIDLLGNHTQDTTIYFGWTDIAPLLCVDSTQQIINNNNQNTQTIVNNITTPTIDSNTTNTDNLITIPNSNGKNTILDLLMVPINFITSIVNSFSNSCVSYNLGNLLGTDLILPCINLENILGSSLYNIIDAIFAFGMIFAFIRSVKKFIQKALLLASDVSSEVSIF